MPRAYHVDYETFSAADLGEVGAYRYAEDPTTEVLMLAIASDTEGPFLWVPQKWQHVLPSNPEADRLLGELWDDPDALVYAHNAQFERAVTMYADSPLFFMRDRPWQWRCTAAMCRRAAIPDSLEKAGAYLGLSAQKDARGKALIRKFSIPQTAGKRKGERILPSDDPEAFREFGDYCLQDVRTEQELHAALAPFDLDGPALDAFLLDIHLNDRGIPVNVPALRNAKAMVDRILSGVASEFRRLTGLSPTQREAVRGWLAEHGCDLPNMQGETLLSQMVELEQNPPKDTSVAPVLRMYQELSFSAVKKVPSMLECANSDGRVRGTLKFNGTGPGRLSAQLIQPQNFKKAEINQPGHPFQATNCVFDILCGGGGEAEQDIITTAIGDPLECIASAIRHFITATLDADYSGLQARVVNWLSGQEDALDRFRRGIDSYKVLASTIFNMRIEEVKNPSKERDVGKEGVLGCGFQLSGRGFLKNCHEKRGMTWVTPAMANRAVDAYRATHSKVVSYWKSNEDAAKNAIRCPGRVFPSGRFTSFQCRFVHGRRFLLAKLPSGREIAYADPKIERWKNEKTGMVVEESITYYGKPTMAAGKTGSVWCRVGTYGGKLTENLTMGVEADLISNGASIAVQRGFDVFTLIHDQALATRLPGQTAEGFCEALTTLPPWAVGLPLKAEGKLCRFYAK